MKYQIQENCLTIYLPKEVDHCHVENIRMFTDEIISKNHIKYVIFDFEKTEFMDSSGIGAIMGRYRLIRLLGGEICGVHVKERMKRILLMSGMNQIMEIYEEEPEYDQC